MGSDHGKEGAIKRNRPSIPQGETFKEVPDGAGGAIGRDGQAFKEEKGKK